MSNFFQRPNDISGKEYILDSPGLTEDFIQLIPATVTGVVNSAESPTTGNGDAGESNMITVKKNVWTPDLPLRSIDTTKFKPLFRGLSDSIAVGDGVLVIYIGSQGFYLGPINTKNSPTYNPDITLVNDVNSTSDDTATSEDFIGASVNFPKQSVFSRMVKDYNVDLDDPSKTLKRFSHPTTGNQVFSDIHTDLTLEGRHGNSVRIGSRNIFPYVFISNGRDVAQHKESINDTSIFGMIEKGTIFQHFGNTTKEFLDGVEYTFKMGDELIEEPINTISKTFASSLGRGNGIGGDDDSDIETTIYGYETGQTFLNSNRITINARTDSLFLSAFQHIHLGSGNSMTFSTSKNVLFNVTDTFVVKSVGDLPFIKLGSEVDDDTEPLVLGDTLIEKLTELNDHLQEIITQIQAITVPTPAGPSGPPANSAAFNVPANSLQDLVASLTDFLSSQSRTI